MTVKPEFVDYVRTMVLGDLAANDRIEAALDEQGWEGFPRYMSALFFVAIDRRFRPGTPKAEIIRFVADLRADVSEGGPPIDAAAAESMIESVLDPSVDYDAPQQMIGTIQAATVYKVLADNALSDAELDEFLAEAARLASRTS